MVFTNGYYRMHTEGRDNPLNSIDRLSRSTDFSGCCARLRRSQCATANEDEKQDTADCKQKATDNREEDLFVIHDAVLILTTPL